LKIFDEKCLRNTGLQRCTKLPRPRILRNYMLRRKIERGETKLRPADCPQPDNVRWCASRDLRNHAMYSICSLLRDARKFDALV